MPLAVGMPGDSTLRLVPARVVATVVLAAAAVGVCSGVASASGSGSGAPVGFHEGRTLEPAASYIARKPVKVWCANSAAAWQRFTHTGTNDTLGMAIPGT